MAETWSAPPPSALLTPKVTVESGKEAARAAADALDPDFEKKMSQLVDTLTPEEREAFGLLVEDAYLRKAMKAIKVQQTTGGKTSLWKLAQEVAKEKELQERGVGKDTLRNRPRYVVNSEIPSETLRAGHYKMQLRPEEQAALQLELLGAEDIIVPHKVFGMGLGGRFASAQGAFAVFGHPQVLRKLLGKRYAGQEPLEVFNNPQFWTDLIAVGRKAELTLMVCPRVDVSLEQCQRLCRDRMAQAMTAGGAEALPPKDAADLDRFVGALSPAAMLASPCTSKDGSVLKANTQLIFSIGPDGRLTGEAIPYLPNKLKTATWLGLHRNPRIGAALFNMFLGPEPISDSGKLEIGTAALYLANGFSKSDDPSNPNQVRFGVDFIRENPVQDLRGAAAFHLHQSLSGVTGEPKPPSVVQGVHRKNAAWQARKAKQAALLQ